MAAEKKSSTKTDALRRLREEQAARAAERPAKAPEPAKKEGARKTPGKGRKP